MTTRRERLERKAEKRREWAAGRRDKANGLRASTPDGLRRDWAFITQPGHIPERARMIRRDDKAVEHDAAARHHDSKADGLERQLDRTIFSDDVDAIERLEEKIDAMEKRRAGWKRINAAHRAYLKNPAALDRKTYADISEADKERIRAYEPAYSWEPHPIAPYQLKNLGSEIRRAKKRIEEIRARQETTARAEAATGGVLIDIVPAPDPTMNYCSVTFAEKPERSILSALKEAGYRWGGGSWTGYVKDLPDCVKEMAGAE